MGLNSLFFMSSPEFRIKRLKGYIALQNHYSPEGTNVKLRNLKTTSLPSSSTLCLIKLTETMRIKNTGLLAHKRAPKVVFVLSVLLFVFYLLTVIVLKDVYANSFVGALFEILSVPMLMLTVAIPVLSILQLINPRQVSVWYTAGSLVLTTVTIIILILNR